MESEGFIDHLLVLRLVEAVGEAALSTVVSVEVARHEHTGAALVRRALPSQTVDLPVLVHLRTENTVRPPCMLRGVVLVQPAPQGRRACWEVESHLVVLEHSELDLLPLVLVLLGGGVGLLLPLLSTSTQTQHQVER